MSASTLWTWIDRIHAYMGTSPQNDFFSSVNHDFLYAANNPLFAGVTPESSFRYTNIVNSRNIQAWVKKALGSTSTDPHLQSAKALYDSVFDAANRADRSLGLLSAVDALASTNEASFLPTLESLSASQGYSPLLTGSSFDTITDPNGSGYVLSELLSAPTYPNSLTGSDLTAYIATQVSAYSEVFKSLGLAEEKATSLGQGYGQALSAIIAAYQAKTTHYDRVRFTDLKGDIYGANFDLFKEFIAMEINRMLREKYPEAEFSWIGEFIEITPKGCSKSQGIAFYLEYNQISKDNVIVVGDSGNDISMFAAYPENSYCMAHANDHVQKHAKHIIKRFSDLEDVLYPSEDSNHPKKEERK